MRLPILLVLLLLVVTTSNAAQQTCRIRSTEGWWTPPVQLDTVRDGWLIFVDGSAPDSMPVHSVEVVRRTRTSHVAGGLVGFAAGLLGALVIVVPYAVGRAGTGHSSGEGSDLPAILAVASITVGTTWGAIGGLDVHPTDDLTLDNLDGAQRETALRHFILDSRLLETD